MPEIERQEDTVIRALDMLDDRPGILLADEVGMGKTYEALGVAAAVQKERPRSRIVIVTPGPDLNIKWFSEFSRFREIFDFGDRVFAADSLPEFMEMVRKHPVVVAPVTIFQSGRGSSAQTYLLSLYFYWKNLHGHTANAIMARFRDGEHDRIDVETEKFLDIFNLNQLEPHLKAAFRRGRSGGAAGLDDLYESGGLSAFEHAAAVRSALYRARFVLTGRLLPLIDLLIVDEAHKLKNPGSLRTRAMRDVFDGRFRKALFLTATPFQLDVAELREIFSLFAGAKDAPEDLEAQIEELLGSVTEYQRQYDMFQQTWSSLDPELAAKFRNIYNGDPVSLNAVEEPALKAVAKQVTALQLLKTETIQPNFQRWMIRSLREDKRIYRRHLPNRIRSAGASALPFLIYERFIAELFRQGRQTHKAAAEINMVSSYAAAQQGAILSNDAAGIPLEAKSYGTLLRDLLDEIGLATEGHPKLATTIADALSAAENGEKTLIFCSRVATLEQLRRELDEIWERRILERWHRVYPSATTSGIFDTREEGDKRQRGRHSLLQARFHRPGDALYLALRESYLWYPALANSANGQLSNVVHEANRILQTIRTGKTAADRIDYQVAKRCIERAAVQLWHPSAKGDLEVRDGVEKLLSADPFHLSIELPEDDPNDNAAGDERPRWQISERVGQIVLGSNGSLWSGQSDLLAELDLPLRVRVVEQLARYLTYKQVLFLPELLEEARASGIAIDPVESAALLEYMPQFWRTITGQRWVRQLRSFLSYFLQRDPSQQIEILDGPIRTGDFTRHTRDGESRDRLREAFNTPLYPMILIANEVMQEGLDLHKHCRRIVHHDLAWNPAQMEQRIGRIDRLGSLTSRLRKDGADVTLDVIYPVIRQTIDERMYRTVKAREKWLEFLLGAAPNFREYAFTDEEPPPLPDLLSKELSINLAPPTGDRH
ncbi:helicase-related protein [Bradyrhizobium diazoefficiens]